MSESPTTFHEMELLDQNVLEELRALVDDDEPDFLNDLLDQFLQDAPLRLASIEAAVQASCADDLRTAAHALKGASRNVGAAALSAQCLALEEAGRSGVLDDTPNLLAHCRECWQYTEEALKKERTGDSPASGS